MGTTIQLKIFQDGEWVTVHEMRTHNVIRPAYVHVCMDTDNWRIWCTMNDLIDNEDPRDEEGTED